MKVASVLLAVLLAGCAGQPIEPSYYLMRSELNLESREINPSTTYSIANVTIASYIDQPGLLLETANGEIRPAQYHQWAEPLYEGVRNQLMVEISLARGEDILPAKLKDTEFVIDIRIDQLHGTHEGAARLVAYWWLRRDKEVIAAHQFAEEQALEAEGYTALVAAEKALLERLAKSIAASMNAPESESAP
jgi:uncharacterized lipoprotein YmbA